MGHNAIYDGTNLIVVGGITFVDSDARQLMKTEKCVISDNQVNCSTQNPKLQDYKFYPELFMVPVDYCKTVS